MVVSGRWGGLEERVEKGGGFDSDQEEEDDMVVLLRDLDFAVVRW